MEEKLKKEVCESNIKSFDKKEAINYDKEHYSEFQEKSFLRNINKIKKALNKEKLKIIDIACGTGRVAYLLLKIFNNSKIFGLDISKDMLEIFQNKLSSEEKKRIKLICEDATDYFKKTKEKFDLIIIEGSLHHIYDYLDLIEESSRKLNNEGYYYISEEPLPAKEYNYYLSETIRIWDKAFYEQRNNKLKLILYFIYAPLNFISPLINKGFLEKIKNRFIHGGENEKSLSEYWGYKKGLDLRRIIDIFRENSIKIVKLELYPSYMHTLANKIGKTLNIKSNFKLIAKKK